jgi:hypothetical protein
VIEVLARTRLLAPPQTATLAVIVNGREIGSVTPDAREASVTALRIGRDSDVLKRGFNRVVLERRAGTAPVGIYRIRLGR